MSFTLELRPETAARARECAAARGVDVGEYLKAVLEQVLQGGPVHSHRPTLEEFDRIMDDLAEGSPEVVAPPVVTRAEIYADHD